MFRSKILQPDPVLQIGIEQYYYHEAELLDNHEYSRWFDLFATDTHYWMPSQANRLFRDRGTEASVEGEFGLFDDTKTTLGWRVKQLNSMTHWAENPRSRTRHLISNVRIKTILEDDEYEVWSNFICYRNRLQDEVDIWAGERQDLLCADAEQGWLIKKRKIILDQNVVLSKNLSVFF
ncbi:MAG: 3-phenylpropionate/cinnamic acid dioxygenase subunit beta [Pseudomonadales bacterium]|nr:3-phenylpropionate/cinnamic acid dioxygenase subunit beta [Pseudomonadales bacterium]